ncbi:MAG: MMPL family transporter [Solirubrobacteraceae bacterium]
MLAAWLLAAAALTLIGLGVSKTLSPTITVVAGTQSARAEKLAGAQFGPTQLIPILLEGPKAQLDRQGPKLVALLARRSHTRVLSAWDAGTASAGLRPAAGTMIGLAFAVAFALLILDRFHREEVCGGPLRRDSAAAAARELQTTGKAVLVAGTALIVALAPATLHEIPVAH